MMEPTIFTSGDVMELVVVWQWPYCSSATSQKYCILAPINVVEMQVDWISWPRPP